jgi:hypothetical protein
LVGDVITGYRTINKIKIPNCTEYDVLAKKIRSYLASMSRSDGIYKEFLNMQLEVQGTTLKFVKDEPTRWDSSKQMFERFIKLKLTINERDKEMFSQDDWSKIETFLTLLEPFEQITKIICQDDAFISIIIPLIDSLKFSLGKLRTKVDNFGMCLINSFIENIPKRLGKYENDLTIIKCTILDPRFKLEPFKTNILINDALESLKLEWTDLNTKNSDAKIITKKFKRDNNSMIIDSCDDLYLQNKDNLISEIEDYLNEPRLVAKINENGKVFEYWSKQRPHRGVLYEMARKYFSIVPTNVFSERTFSSADDIFDNDRNQLDPIKGEMLQFIKANSYIID